MKIRLFLAACLFFGCLAIITFATEHKTAIDHTVETSPAKTPVSPLTIAAVRAHPTPGGKITTTGQLAPRGGCPTSVISYPSDGLTQYALLSVPPTQEPAGGYPVIILAHGYIVPSQYQTAGTDYEPWIEAACNAGYLVLKPDYRGNGMSEGASLDGHFSPDYTYDVLNLVASLHSLPEANPRRVALVGHSMGGDVVLRALVASHNLPIKAAVIVSGAVDSLQKMAYDWPTAPADVTTQKATIIEQYGTPSENPTFWHDASSINYVSAISVPVQIDVGTADTTVPPQFSADLARALTRAKVTHEYDVYPGADHQFSGSSNTQLLLSRILTFLNSNL